MYLDAISEELMNEVKALQHVIRECCPEIESIKDLRELDQLPGDEMNDLISHRIEVLTRSSRCVTDSNTQ